MFLLGGARVLREGIHGIDEADSSGFVRCTSGQRPANHGARAEVDTFTPRIAIFVSDRQQVSRGNVAETLQGTRP